MSTTPSGGGGGDASALPLAPAPGQGAMAFPCGEPPEAGQCREIAPGLGWVRMPLPFALNHINLWLLADEDAHGPGWALVDTGASSPQALQAWTALLADQGPLARSAQGRRLTRVICTHMHPDHIGMAGWLTRLQGAPLHMTALEYFQGRTLVADTGREAPPEALAFYAAAGWGEEALARYRARFGGFGRLVHAMPECFERLEHGQPLAIGGQVWQVVVGRGHSPEHASLWCEARNCFIAGDQLLPSISSNVSVHPSEPEADPLADWLRALAHLRSLLNPETLVLPAHGQPFTGAPWRLERLAQGHRLGLQRLGQSLAQGRLRAVDTFPALFGRAIDQTSDLLGLATGEALAHLHHLCRLGQARRETDAAGVHWYSAVPAG